VVRLSDGRYRLYYVGTGHDDSSASIGAAEGERPGDLTRWSRVSMTLA
jgi:hypothetical protein